jgi:hypothetical protein
MFVYLELEADAAAARARAIVRACRRHDGDAVLLYHNDGLASQGMRRHYEQLVADLVGGG